MSSAERVDALQPSFGDLFAAEIRAEMGRRGVTPAELARRLNVSHTWPNRRGLGRVTVSQVAMSTDEIEQIAGVLGVGVPVLLRNVYRQLAEAADGQHADDAPLREGQITRQIR